MLYITQFTEVMHFSTLYSEELLILLFCKGIDECKSQKELDVEWVGDTPLQPCVVSDTNGFVIRHAPSR